MKINSNLKTENKNSYFGVFCAKFAINRPLLIVNRSNPQKFIDLESDYITHAIDKVVSYKLIE